MVINYENKKAEGTKKFVIKPKFKSKDQTLLNLKIK